MCQDAAMMLGPSVEQRRVFLLLGLHVVVQAKERLT
jgi:hypothetical protein